MLKLKNRVVSWSQSLLMRLRIYSPKLVWYSYSTRDFQIVDYQAYQLDKLPYSFRGPKPVLKNKKYISFLGAAQTFGVFCRKPFPDLIKDELGCNIINLGMGGAGPGHFLHKELLSVINDSKIAVVQVLSARSVENSVMEDCTGTITIRATGEKLSSKDAYNRVLSNPEFDAEQIISETRQNYTKAYKELLDKITVPKILFWFSDRDPAYQDDFSSVDGIFNSFPHMVNQEIINIIAMECDEFVSCTTNRGLPQKLISRFTNKPVSIIDGPGKKPKTHNYYYPSPEMHTDAAKVLLPVIQNYL